MSFELDNKRSVFNHYGPRTTTGRFGAEVCDELVKWAVWDFTYANLPTYGASNMQLSIPANATIVSARLLVDTAFTSTSTTTDLTVGLYTSAGNVISAADGLITAANASQTTIAVENSLITGSGGLIGLGIGASAGELVVASSAADLLTGAGRVIVEYIYNS
jgi:hypothetical protein